MSYFLIFKRKKMFDISRACFTQPEKKMKITFIIVRNTMQTYPSTSSQAT